MYEEKYLARHKKFEMLTPRPEEQDGLLNAWRNKSSSGTSVKSVRNKKRMDRLAKGQATLTTLDD